MKHADLHERLAKLKKIPPKPRPVYNFWRANPRRIVIGLVIYGWLFAMVLSFMLPNYWVRDNQKLTLDGCGVNVHMPKESKNIERTVFQNKAENIWYRWQIIDLGADIYCFSGEGKVFSQTQIYVLPVDNLVVQTSQFPLKNVDRQLTPKRVAENQPGFYLVRSDSNLILLRLTDTNSLPNWRFLLA